MGRATQGGGGLQLRAFGLLAFGGRSVRGPRSESRVEPRRPTGPLVLTRLRVEPGENQCVGRRFPWKGGSSQAPRGRVFDQGDGP